MKKTTHILVSLVIGAFLLIGCGNTVTEQQFSTRLSGEQMVPSVQTKATGEATFATLNNRRELQYQVNVQDLSNITMAHLHLALPDSNGPIIAWLYQKSGSPQLIPGDTSGVLVQDTLRASNLTGPLTGKSISDLVAEIDSGHVAVIVHTKQNPSGEIRGQVHPGGSAMMQQ